jgi:hypothetical protein
MKNIRDVLREKEAELQQLEKEVEALRLAVSLVSQEASLLPAGVIVPVASPKVAISAPSFEERSCATTVSGTTTSRQFP